MNASGCTATVVVGTLHIGGKRCFTDWPIHSIGLGLPERPTLERGWRPSSPQGALYPNAVGADGRGSMLSRTYPHQRAGCRAVVKIPLEWVHVEGGEDDPSRPSNVRAADRAVLDRLCADPDDD